LQQSLPEGEVTLTLRDDGIGLAGNGDGNRHGLGLVDRLMQQIHGRAEVCSDHGTAWRLSFPISRDEGSGSQASVQKVRP
jgi:two-component sensor histidine kinase